MGNLLLRNLGLLFKWIWRYFQEPHALWRQIIAAKYKYPQEFRMADFSYIRQGGPWKLICNKILNHEGSRKLLEPVTRMKLGNGERALFWHDPWLNNSALKNQFPRLFLIARLPLATVAAMAQANSSGCQWSIPWIRPLRIRDQEEWDLLYQLLLQVRIHEDKADSMVWKPSRSGSYSVKSFYMELSKGSGLHSSSCLQQITPKLWKNHVPYKIEVFFWLALHGKINTKKKIALLKILLMEEIFCSFCKTWPEDTSHIFLHCPFAHEIWGSWWKMWDISWV